MSEKNEFHEWLANAGIITLLENSYGALKEVVADYGYVTRQADGSLVGRTSTEVRYMFIVPQPDMAAKFQSVAQRMGVSVQAETLKMDGVPTDGFLVRDDMILARMARGIVKDRQAQQQALAIQAARFQAQH